MSDGSLKDYTVKYSYSGVPTLREFANCDAFFRIVTGPFGSGKSSASIIEIISRALAQKPGPDGVARTRWIVIRNTYRQLADSTIKSFLQWMPPVYFGEFKQTTNTYTIKSFENCEIEIQFRALDKPSDVGNLLSVEATGAWINEGREVPWPIIEAVQGRVGRYPAQKDGGPSWYGIWIDTNPSDTDSKLYKYACETEHDPKYFKLFMQPSGLSPQAENLKNLPGGVEYYKRMAVGKDPEWVKVYVHGQFGYVQDGRPVFPEYYDSTHCAEVKFLSAEPIYRGWDFGLTPSCVFAQFTPNGQLIVLDELVSETMGADNFSDEVIAHSTQYYPDAQFIDVGDPAGQQRAQTDEKTCFQILHSKGIEIEAGLQSLQIRLESVRRPLTRLVMGRPGFQLHPRCKTLRKAFMGGYQFRRLQTSQEKYTAVPDKNQYSHAMDALQYIATRLFGEGLTSYNPRAIPDRDLLEMDGGGSRSDITGY
jgi:hypothetical protein